jgi:exopolysaccharide production protein ExoQ
MTASVRARTYSSGTPFDWYLALLAVAFLAAMPFIVGDQPQGAESLNPVDLLRTISAEGDATKQAILLSMYGLFTGLLLYRERLRSVLLLGTPLLVLLVWTFASAAWSVDPQVTIHRAVALSGTVAMGLYLGLRLELRQMLSVLSAAALLVLCGSLILAIVSPGLGLDFEGRLRGVTAHKNALGSFAALAFLVTLARLNTTGRGSSALMFVLSLACMALAHSTAVFLVLAVALATLVFGHFLRRANSQQLALLPLAACGAVALVVLAAGHSGEIAELLGKDSDISGRTLVWEFVKKMILAEPLLGYGFGAFWVGGNSPGAVFWSNTHLGVPHAHNGFLQLSLEAGVTALALILAATASLAIRTLHLMRRTRRDLTVWALGFLAFYLVANLSETWLWIGNELLPMVFVYLVVRTNAACLASAATSPGFVTISSQPPEDWAP